MKAKTVTLLGLGVAGILATAQLAMAADPQPAPMTFFVTSVGLGDGGNLGGLAGADAQCRKLASAVGRGDATWRAYLSTQGPDAVNARDRIGSGPWHNQRGQLIGKGVAELHGDTIEQARAGVIIGRSFAVTEKGEMVAGVGDPPPVRHDILTGSTPEGRAYSSGEDKTCNNWTSNGPGKARVGHHDKQGGGGGSWNSQHDAPGCSSEKLASVGGAGLLYCFAAD